MRVYITGASGFVGQRLVPRLVEAGMSVISRGMELDICDESAVRGDLENERPDAVIHLAAQSSVAASWQDPASCFRVNYLGTRNLIRSIETLGLGCRLLLIGSADEYETTRPKIAPYRETAPLRPGSPYARTKAAGELLGGLAASRGLDVVRVRAFNHTGAGQTDRFVASSFAKQIAEIASGVREPRMQVGNLESVRDFLDVDDVVEAYLALLDPSVPASVYNIASGVPVKIATLLELMMEVSGVTPEVETNPDFFRPTDQLIGDATRLREATGWKPRIPLRETVASMLEGWRIQIESRPQSSSPA
jgi:GDP-4-dehydro-6-deoxy-D-mannose reductase